MSFFSKSESPPPSSAPAPRPRPAAPTPSSTATHIASGSKVVGEISGAAELVIDGEVEGKVRLESRVIVGSKGVVVGEVEALSVQVSGKVLGNVTGRDRVEVTSSGRLEGDLVSPQVHIADGAFFTGKIEMSKGPSKTSPRPEAGGRIADGKSEKGGAPASVADGRRPAEAPAQKAAAPTMPDGRPDTPGRGKKPGSHR